MPINLGRQDNHILQEIENKLSKLQISNINEESSSEDDISDIENQFKENEIPDIEKQFRENEINKMRFTSKNTYTPRPEARNYYNRPTLPDMQYEESPVRQRALYDGLSIYEWNLDGQTEYQILNILQEMTMASNAYKTHKNTESQIVEILISGFTGSLKGWWDNYVSENEKSLVFKAKKTIVKNENEMPVETQEDDMVNTLIFAILKNFVGNPSVYQERNSSILLNLTCRKLSDFRWYKDVFITKVTTRLDCREAYWKERFIAGLPKLFAERIRRHTSKNCYTKKRINELNISDKLKSQIMKIMINEESDISDDEEEDLNILENKESSSDNESEIYDCIGNCTCDYKEINTINEDNEI
ncbi:hypothetical protein Tco_1109392 [Tanacetum coccineum]